MIKHRRLSKKAAAAVLSAVLLLGSSTTVLAYVDPGEEQPAQTAETAETTPADSGQEAAAAGESTAGEGAVLEETDQTGTAFSSPGNGQVQDDIKDDSTKEFLTITTKNNNTFYLVIDRSGSSENVYMLSQIDENDLQKFLDRGEIVSEAAAVPSVVMEENDTATNENENVEETVQEEKHEKETAGNPAGILAILLLAGAGVGAYYYFKIRKKKEDAGEENTEGIELSDGLETIDEDEDEYE